MIILNWSTSFKKAFRKTIKSDVQLKERILSTMELQQSGPFSNKLKSHKL